MFCMGDGNQPGSNEARQRTLLKLALMLVSIFALVLPAAA